MSKLVISISKLVIDDKQLPLLEELMRNASKLVDCDYSHRVGNNYIEYLNPERVFDAVELRLLDSGKAAIMEMYYDEHVKKN